VRDIMDQVQDFEREPDHDFISELI
jgi:hypothetical protein